MIPFIHMMKRIEINGNIAPLCGSAPVGPFSCAIHWHKVTCPDCLKMNTGKPA